MAIAALAHRFVFPASPYIVSLNYVSRRKLSISPSSDTKKPLLEIDEAQECRTDSCGRVVDADVKVSSTSLKDSVQDVVLGGGETVRVLSLYKNCFNYDATSFFMSILFLVSNIVHLISQLVMSLKVIYMSGPSPFPVFYQTIHSIRKVSL